LFTSYELLIFT